MYILTHFIAALGFLSESKAHLANRRALAVSKREKKKKSTFNQQFFLKKVYPLFLFYLIIAWLVAVS